MSDSRPRLRVFGWAKRLRDRLLGRLRAHVALALADDFRNLTTHVAAAKQQSSELAAELTAKLTDKMPADLAALVAAEHAAERAAVEARHQQDLARLEKLVADYERRMHDSNLFADSLAREIIRLQQQIDELLEAVDGVADVVRHDAGLLPATLKYREAA